MTHTEVARQFARRWEFGMGNKSQFLRAVGVQTGKVIMPRTKVAEEAILAFHDERQIMQREKQTLWRLEMAFKA